MCGSSIERAPVDGEAVLLLSQHHATLHRRRNQQVRSQSGKRVALVAPDWVNHFHLHFGQKQASDVKLLNLDKKAKDLLQMTKLLTYFDTYNDEAKAIESLNK